MQMVSGALGSSRFGFIGFRIWGLGWFGGLGLGLRVLANMRVGIIRNVSLMALYRFTTKPILTMKAQL